MPELPASLPYTTTHTGTGKSTSSSPQAHPIQSEDKNSVVESPAIGGRRVKALKKEEDTRSAAPLTPKEEEQRQQNRDIIKVLTTTKPLLPASNNILRNGKQDETPLITLEPPDTAESVQHQEKSKITEMEQIKSPSTAEKPVVVSYTPPNIEKKQLSKVLELLRCHLETGTWTLSTKPTKQAFPYVDAQLMPYLIKLANHEYPKLNLRHAPTVKEAFDQIFKELKRSRLKHETRYVVFDPEAFSQTHVATIDCMLMDTEQNSKQGKLSIIGLVQSKHEDKEATMAAKEFADAIDHRSWRSVGEDAFAFSMVCMETLKSEDDYETNAGIVTFSCAKKLHEHKDSMKEFHLANIRNKFNAERAVPQKVADEHLPQNFFLHEQSKERLNAELTASEKDPESLPLVVANEAPLQQQVAELIQGSFGTHKKWALKTRIDEYENLWTTCSDNQGPKQPAPNDRVAALNYGINFFNNWTR